MSGLPIYFAGIDAVRANNGAWQISKDGVLTINLDAVPEPVPVVCVSCGSQKNPDGTLPCDH